MIEARRQLAKAARFKDASFLPVLAAVIGMFVVSPVLTRSSAGEVALNLLAFCVLLGALHAAGLGGWPLRTAVALAGLTWFMLVLRATADVNAFLGPRVIITAGLWIGAPIFVLSRVLREKRVSLNTVAGALVVYFLIGLLFGFMYDFIEQIDAGSFAFPGPPQENYTDELVYYSIVTQTTLGFGDITPMKELPRTLTAAQAVIGQVYLVVLVARLVAMQLAHDRGSPV